MFLAAAFPSRKKLENYSDYFFVSLTPNDPLALCKFIIKFFSLIRNIFYFNLIVSKASNMKYRTFPKKGPLHFFGHYETSFFPLPDIMDLRHQSSAMGIIMLGGEDTHTYPWFATVYALLAESHFAESMGHFAEFFSAKWTSKSGKVGKAVVYICNQSRMCGKGVGLGIFF